MSILAAAVVGLLAGAHIATWGMYKDSPHEGFTWPKYMRSVLVGAAAAPLAAAAAGVDAASWPGAVLLFGLVYGVERALVEFYKTFVRVEDQSKYTIPMQFHIGGRVVTSTPLRVLVAGVYIVTVAALLWIAARLRADATNLSTGTLVLIGSIGGWISAIGGAWKDAPIEGFETLKFFRSPGLAAAYAWLLTYLTRDPIVVAVAALGYTVASTETYKTFFFPSKPRGKFAGKPILFPGMLTFRNRFVPLYVGIWLAVVLGVVMALQAA